MFCPNCGKILEETFLEFEEYNCKIYATYEAHCHNCHNDWRWEDVYEYAESTAPYQIHYDHL
jgi:methionyl-tRNA synthetase